MSTWMKKRSLGQGTLPGRREKIAWGEDDAVSRRVGAYERWEAAAQGEGTYPNIHENMLEFCSFKWEITKFNPSNFPPFQKQ